MDITPHVVNSDVRQQIYVKPVQYLVPNVISQWEKVHVQIIENCISCNRNFNCVTMGFCYPQKCSSYDFDPYTTDCGGNQYYLLIDVTQQNVDMMVNHVCSISSYIMVCTTIGNYTISSTCSISLKFRHKNHRHQRKSASRKLKEKEQYEEYEQYEIQQDLGLPEEFDDNQDGDDEMKDSDGYDSSNKKSTIKTAASTGTANITGSTVNTNDGNENNGPTEDGSMVFVEKLHTIWYCFQESTRRARKYNAPDMVDD
ncbi:hypothetical protein ACTA71_007118 [Dictyostelium dimigraforme]